MERFTLIKQRLTSFNVTAGKGEKMGTDTGVFVLLITGSQGSSCVVTFIYSKKETRSFPGRSHGDMSEVYQEEKIYKIYGVEQKKETRSIGIISIQSRRLICFERKFSVPYSLGEITHLCHVSKII